MAAQRADAALRRRQSGSATDASGRERSRLTKPPQPTNPFDTDTPTAHVPPHGAGAPEESGRQPNSSPDVTRESPGGPSVLPVASRTGPNVPTAFGRYAVPRSLGAGGFGEVYLGHDTLLDRPVLVPAFRVARPSLWLEQALVHHPLVEGTRSRHSR